MKKLKIKIPVILPQVPNEKDACVERLIKELEAENGLEKVHIADDQEDTVPQLCFHYDPDIISIDRIQSLAERTGAEITEKYGFPSTKRIKMYYEEEFNDPEFNPYILLIHAPKEYWNELITLMKNELDNNRISKCTYGHMLWHFTGRKSFQPMLDNGYEMVEENGKTILKSTCK